MNAPERAATGLGVESLFGADQRPARTRLSRPRDGMQANESDEERMERVVEGLLDQKTAVPSGVPTGGPGTRPGEPTSAIAGGQVTADGSQNALVAMAQRDLPHGQGGS